MGAGLGGWGGEVRAPKVTHKNGDVFTKGAPPPPLAVFQYNTPLTREKTVAGFL